MEPMVVSLDFQEMQLVAEDDSGVCTANARINGGRLAKAETALPGLFRHTCG